jgi:hypothetical protein
MTASTLPRSDVEFTTLDGLTLRGWLFPASQRGPALIMSPGVRVHITNCLVMASKYPLTDT